MSDNVPDEVIEFAGRMVDTGNVDFRVGWSPKERHVVIGVFIPGQEAPRFAFGVSVSTAMELVDALRKEIRRRSS